MPEIPCDGSARRGEREINGTGCKWIIDQTFTSTVREARLTHM
jgi:hypothetical protein